MLEILEDEMICEMGLLGVTSSGQLTPDYVCRAEAVEPLHEMSSWVTMPVGRNGSARRLVDTTRRVAPGGCGASKGGA